LYKFYNKHWILIRFLVVLIFQQKYFFSEIIILNKYLSLSFWRNSLVSLTLMMFLLIFIRSYYVSFHYNLFSIVYLTMLWRLLIFFLAENLVLFYFIFEFSIFPILWLVIGWGYQPERVRARFFFLIYTIRGSLPFLIMIILLKINGQMYFYQINLIFSLFNNTLLQISYIVIVFPFLVKLPIFGAHLWLPKAHTEAPVYGSIILAALLLKIGGFGLFRFLRVWTLSSPLIFIFRLVIWGACLTRLVCFQELDLKIVVAYSSIGHIGVACYALLTNTIQGELGRLVIFLAHGFSSSLIFYFTIKFYSNCSSRNLLLLKNQINLSPALIFIWFFTIMSCMSAPPRINLFGEIFSFLSLIKSWQINFILRTILIFLTGVYSIWIYSLIHHGVYVSKSLKNIKFSLIDKILRINHLLLVYLIIFIIDIIV